MLWAEDKVVLTRSDLVVPREISRTSLGRLGVQFSVVHNRSAQFSASVLLLALFNFFFALLYGLAVQVLCSTIPSMR